MLLLLVGGLVLSEQAIARSFCDDDGDWSLTWQDEFNDGALNRSTWTVPVGAGSSFGREANVTLEDTFVADGALVLRSRALPNGAGWTTGAAISRPRSGGSSGAAAAGSIGAAWRYGRFCVRARLPGSGAGARSQGLWPAHWMMPSDYTRHCGYNEIDIMEMVDGSGHAYGTYWFWGQNASASGPGGSHCSGPPVRAGSSSVSLADYWSAYHEYAVEWTPTSLTFLVDSVPYQSFAEPANGSRLVPINEHFMMLNTAIGGAWPGSANSSTVFPAYHYIDYVRVAQNAAHAQLAA